MPQGEIAPHKAGLRHPQLVFVSAQPPDVTAIANI
jgi:hypothetical protein